MPVPFAPLPATSPSLRDRVEVYFGRVLDGQNMPAARCYARLFGPTINQPFNRHMLVRQEPSEANRLRSPLAQSAQTYALARDHAFEQRRPPFRGDDPRTVPRTRPN